MMKVQKMNGSIVEMEAKTYDWVSGEYEYDLP